MTPAARVYRAPMRSRRDDIPIGAAVERALQEGLCGIGGILDEPPSNVDSAILGLQIAHGDRAAVRLERFVAVENGAFVWTRDIDGAYLLGRLEGGWRYDQSQEAREVDLVHVRPCAWLPEPIEAHLVPPATLQTFARGGRNFQQTHDPSVGAQTAAIWDRTVSS